MQHYVIYIQNWPDLFPSYNYSTFLIFSHNRSYIKSLLLLNIQYAVFFLTLIFTTVNASGLLSNNYFYVYVLLLFCILVLWPYLFIHLIVYYHFKLRSLFWAFYPQLNPPHTTMLHSVFHLFLWHDLMPFKSSILFNNMQFSIFFSSFIEKSSEVLWRFPSEIFFLGSYYSSSVILLLLLKLVFWISNVHSFPLHFSIVPSLWFICFLFWYIFCSKSL